MVATIENVCTYTYICMYLGGYSMYRCTYVHMSTTVTKRMYFMRRAHNDAEAYS